MKRRNQQGLAMVEFTIIAFVLFMLLFGIIEFSIILFDKAVITNASREGARAGIVAQYDPVTGYRLPPDPTQISNVVINYFSNIPLIPGPRPPNVTVTPVVSGNQFSVTVAWNYTLLLFPQLISTPINLAATTVMNLE